MKDFLDTIIPFWKTVARKVKGKMAHCNPFNKKLENSISIHPITKHYQNKIKDVLKETDDIQERIDYIIETFTELVKRYNLTDEKNQDLVFEQIINFINYLYLELKSKYIFNTLNKNNLKEFNEQTIWDKIGTLIQREWDTSYTWCCCRHYALLFKHIFDKIEEKIKFWISSYLYLEKTDWLNHAWLVVTFKWKNYLVDSSFFNGKFMQPVDLVWKHYDRMKILSDLHEEDIQTEETQILKDEYMKHDYNYYKVALKSADDLLSLLEFIPQEQVWSFSKMYNIFDNTFWINFRISNEGIVILNTFTYHFNHTFKKEELDNVSDDELMDLIINSISYKTNDDNRKTWKFNGFYYKCIK